MIFGDVEHSFEGERNIGGEVHFVLVFLSSIGEILKERLVVLGRDFTFGTHPYRFDEVDHLVVDEDGKVDKIGVFLYDLLNGGLLQELFAFFLQMKNDSSASLECFVSISFRNIEGS